MRLLSFYALCTVAFAFAGCGPDYDPTADRFAGEAAKQRIEREAEAKGGLPGSARDFYIFDGGNFGGSIIYMSFDCGSREDCWASVACLGGPGPAEFKPWAESHYAVVMEGPGFYHQPLRRDPWNVRGITNGAVYERVDGDHRSMHYYAIDFDRDRVYYHRESGGFPPEPYRPKAAE
jgi:hypothetical protein